jgi:phosphonate transport system substrate-binding protein
MRRLDDLSKLFCYLLLILLTLANNAAAETQQFIVGVVPQFPAPKTHKEWTPFLEKVSKESGILLTIKVYQNIPEFEADVMKGGPDFAFMNPYHEVMAKKSAGYLPLVRETEPLIGCLVVPKDSNARYVRDMEGKQIAFPAPNAFAASLYMRALLSDREGVAFKPVYVKTHSNVIRQVILGEQVAGGVASNAFQLESESVRAQIRILYETPGVAAHPLAAHPRVPKATREAVKAAILKMGKDDEALPLLRAVNLEKPVVADYERDYLPLERLHIDKYVEIKTE